MKIRGNNLKLLMDNWRYILSAFLQRPDEGVLDGLFVKQLRHCDAMKMDLAVYDRTPVGEPAKSYEGVFNAVLRILRQKSEEK